MLHRNGTNSAPRTERGAFAAQRTEFPAPRPVDSSRALAYQLARQQWLTFPLLRWATFAVVLLVILWLLLRLPGSPAVIALGAAVIVALWVWQRTARAAGYVRFTPEPLEAVSPARQEAALKRPVYVSGWLTVQNKAQLFAGVPGFYRTFPTREHALLCQVRPPKLLGVAEWPAEETGLWYVFFRPEQISAVRAGRLQHDRTPLPALAVTYRPSDPALLKRRGQAQQTTVYIAFNDAAERSAVLADLMVEGIHATAI